MGTQFIARFRTRQVGVPDPEVHDRCPYQPVNARWVAGKMASRRRARQFALQLLFQEDITHYTPDEIRQLFWESNPADPDTRKFAELLFIRSLQNRLEIDDLIRRHAQNWRLERMAVVDRNVLRMAISEFLCVETPKIVVIDEAIEIVRKYGGQESTDFINGILDAVRQELEGRSAEKDSDDG